MSDESIEAQYAAMCRDILGVVLNWRTRSAATLPESKVWERHIDLGGVTIAQASVSENSGGQLEVVILALTAEPAARGNLVSMTAWQRPGEASGELQKVLARVADAGREAKTIVRRTVVKVVRAALADGHPPEEVLDMAREALVQEVMES